MKETLLFAGFYAAHGVWCISGGDTLCPILGWETGGERFLHRLENEKYEAAVAEGRTFVEANPDEAERMVLVYDGFITLPSGRTDALFVEAREYVASAHSFTIAIPYRHANHANGFAVHRLKLIAWNAPEDFERVAQSLQDGIDSHEEAAAVWSKHLDESI